MGKETCIECFGGETDRLEDLDTDEKILKRIFKTLHGGMDWINLAEDGG
jgi:hypothetical protein